MLALLDERERNQQYIKRRDQENEDIALTVGKLRVELEGKDSKIANLTAERDALREGEMGDARHSNTRAAADIYFQLVEECEIPAGGSLVEYVDDMREKLEAAEKRIAELESGSQAQKLVEAIIVAIENEQERLFDEDYLMDSKECIDVIREEVKRWNDSRAAGIRSNCSLNPRLKTGLPVANKWNWHGLLWHRWKQNRWRGRQPSRKLTMNIIRSPLCILTKQKPNGGCDCIKSVIFGQI